MKNMYTSILQLLIFVVEVAVQEMELLSLMEIVGLKDLVLIVCVLME